MFLLLFYLLVLDLGFSSCLLCWGQLLSTFLFLLLSLSSLPSWMLKDNLVINCNRFHLHMLRLTDHLILIFLLLPFSPLTIPIKLQYHLNSLLKNRTLLISRLNILIQLYLNQLFFDSCIRQNNTFSINDNP